jgi:chaperone BCS1
VDLRVEFKLAMKEQISELFVRMYAASDVPKFDIAPDVHGGALSNGSLKSHANGHNGHVPNGNGNVEKQAERMSGAELEELAMEFARHVPDDTFTPAEIQNHLMRHKKEPRVAVGKTSQWAKELLEEKEKQAQAQAQETGGGEEGA